MSDAHGVARDQLRSFIERIERLEAEKQTIADDIKDVYGEAKSTGFDAKILRKVIAIRKQDADERAEQEAILDSYLHALGMIQMDMFEEPETSPKLVATVATAMQTQAGRAALLTAVDIMIEREERIDPTTGEILDDQASDGTAPVAGTSLAARGAEESAVPNSEIASASQGEAEDHSDQCETDRIEAAATGVGANEGGENVDSSAKRAGLEGGPVNLEPTGPVAEWATDLADDGIRYEASPPRPMKSLPYAACFPELSHAHYQQLSDSIANNGVREPIVRMGDVIVDGWSRYNISRSLGIEYPVVSYLGNDVLLDVIAWQREARQFTRSQERQIAARLAKEVPHRASEIMRAFQIEEELA